MRASIALPGILSPARVDGKWLVDGGLSNPIPVSVCRALGADVTHAFATGMWNDLVNLTKQGFEDIFPNAAGYLQFAGYFNDHSFNQPVDNVLSAKIGVDITDNVSAHSGAPA